MGAALSLFYTARVLELYFQTVTVKPGSQVQRPLLHEKLPPGL